MQRPLHRHGKSTTNARYKKKLLGRANWYKEKTSKRDTRLEEEHVWHSPQKGIRKEEIREHKREDNKKDNNKISSLLFIDRTKEGGLTTKLREVEKELGEMIGDKVKIIEKAGDQIKGLLWKADPWGLPCSDVCCPVCLEEEEDMRTCKRKNIV